MTKSSRSGIPDVIAVWPCEHGNVLIEPGRALPNYRCHTCGSVARTYYAGDAFTCLPNNAQAGERINIEEDS